jgi:hypothetical protein
MKKVNIEVKDFLLGLLLGISLCMGIYIYHGI